MSQRTLVFVLFTFNVPMSNIKKYYKQKCLSKLNAIHTNYQNHRSPQTIPNQLAPFYILFTTSPRFCEWMGLTTLPPSHAKCLEILGASTSWSPKGLPQTVMGQLYFPKIYLSFFCLHVSPRWSHLICFSTKILYTLASPWKLQCPTQFQFFLI